MEKVKELGLNESKAGRYFKQQVSKSLLGEKLNSFFFFFCRILVPQPGIEPRPPAEEGLSPNHVTTREFTKTQCYEVLWGYTRHVYLPQRFLLWPRVYQPRP